MAEENTIVPKKDDTKYRESVKFDKWVECFLDVNNKDIEDENHVIVKRGTYGNATQSALVAYDLDPKTQYFSAGKIGSENYKKVKNLASRYAETKGIGVGRMIDVALGKTIESKSPDWWDRLMQLFGFMDMKGGVIFPIQVNNYEGMTDEQITERITDIIERGEVRLAGELGGAENGPEAGTAEVQQNAPKAMGSGYGPETH